MLFADRLVLGALISVSIAVTETTSLGTVTSSGTLAAPSGSPSTCIDNCFNSATGSGTQAGCLGISGQYECICTMHGMMQDFEACMSTTCALGNTTIQETLGNVQQICASCTPNGCNSFAISASGNGGGTITAQVPSATFSQSFTPPSVCYTTTQSFSIAPGSGGAVGGGFFSAGIIPCASSLADDNRGSTSALGSLSTGASTSSTTIKTTSSATSAHRPLFRSPRGVVSLAASLALGAALL
ncbi:hypothetical protein B0H16DRAFT_687044 [Mycena metata]|uniref:Extracellular membrane protein CFEM domain-containing protein n=1 Tax=Mycena metata TaxID=1033252 RepID=A0AAD7J4G1_9AGAR|nr:hypothetical protein B0H16DRAFT_687044 [Mycena metata]